MPKNPLSIFYFFLPKELWRRIAAETNKYRLDSVDEVAQGMRRRALEKRLTTPSTTVLSVEEYRVKLRRKNSIQPHDINRHLLWQSRQGRNCSSSDAVVVNLQHVLQGQSAQRLIFTDNYYSSIPLSHKLLAMGTCTWELFVVIARGGARSWSSSRRGGRRVCLEARFELRSGVAIQSSLL
ncbi:hypothetical protein L917_16395 [Phytophthora nicotianae]|uniref:PiggyBac transposable element-derived protein domain-containing protein n=1 Tax=Phytophthora nicotianae TaxID=4792 RepID=W2KH79_PHYNI|nr:hypothetical protein L917_16395 [Phytophthora nicotianae]